jgi:hypothetical protein
MADQTDRMEYRREVSIRTIHSLSGSSLYQVQLSWHLPNYSAIVNIPVLPGQKANTYPIHAVKEGHLLSHRNLATSAISISFFKSTIQPTRQSIGSTMKSLFFTYDLSASWSVYVILSPTFPSGPGILTELCIFDSNMINWCYTWNSYGAILGGFYIQSLPLYDIPAQPPSVFTFHEHTAHS